MAPNATATKPDKAPTPKKAARRPPDDTVWLRYHPWMEGLVGHVASWAVHLFMIGIPLLIVLAYAMGWIKSNTKVPVEAVVFADAGGGGGNPNGSGNDRNNQGGPPREGVQGNQNSSGAADHPADRPQLNDVQTHPNNVSFDPPLYVQQDPNAAQSVAYLDKQLSRNLGNPSKGVSGTGTAGGEGSGVGPGVGPGAGPGNKGVMKSERMKRMDRWNMSIGLASKDRSDFPLRLQMLGTTLAIPDDPDHMQSTKFTIIDMSKQPYETKSGDVTDLNQIWWYIGEPEDLQVLSAALHLPGRPKLIIAFMSQELEAALSKKEIDYYPRIPPDQLSARVEKTTFEVAVFGPRKWDIQVTGGKLK